MNARAVVAEAIGTFILVLVGSLGVGSAILGTGAQDPTAVLLIVPFAFGLGLMAAIVIAGGVSGGHFNPAVTLAAVIDGRLGWVDALGYAVAQILGAVAASLAIQLILTPDFVAATVTRVGSIAADGTTAQIHAFATEALLTTIFVAVILTVTRKAPNLAVLAIPLTLVVIHFAGMAISGASVNPARSLAPAVVSGDYDGLWVYLTGPFVGSILGWGVYRFLNPPDDDEVEAEGVDDGFGDEDDQDDDR